MLLKIFEKNKFSIKISRYIFSRNIDFSQLIMIKVISISTRCELAQISISRETCEDLNKY